MQRILRVLACAVLFVVGLASARAQDYVDQSAIDELFAALRHAQTAADADSYATEIRSFWLHPDVPSLERRMGEAAWELRRGDVPRAINDFSSIVHDYPDYAEGWNQRATLYFMTGEYDRSLADIAKVLAIEPRHFGALSGRAMIYLKQGNRASALRDLAAALRIHPFLTERRLFPELGQPITYI